MYYEALEVRDASHCLLSGQLSPLGALSAGRAVRERPGRPPQPRDSSPGSRDICASLPHAQKPGRRPVRPFVQDLIGSDSVL